MAKVGFIGLGTMGFPMARNLLRGGNEMRVYDINPKVVEQLAGEGALAATSPAEAAEGVEVLITMLPNAPHVRTALFGENGAAAALDRKALYIDMSTIHPQESDSIAEAMKDLGIRTLDAPVGRTSLHAEQGKLLIMVGAEIDDLERARPLLDLMGDTIIHCGPRGAGARIKVVNNFMSTALAVLSGEALTLAEAVGLDIDTTIKVLNNTPAGQGHFSTTFAGKVLAGDLTPGFMVDLAHKDLGLGLDVAAAMNVPVPVAAAARETYSLARRKGLGRKDWTVVYEMMRAKA